MAILIPIPIPVTPHHTIQVELDGVTFTLAFRWNGRAEAWFFSLMDAEEQPLAMGRRLVLDFPLLARFRRNRASLPAGQFVAVDTANTGVEAGLQDLGTRVQVLYIPAAELAA